MADRAALGGEDLVSTIRFYNGEIEEGVLLEVAKKPAQEEAPLHSLHTGRKVFFQVDMLSLAKGRSLSGRRHSGILYMEVFMRRRWRNTTARSSEPA